MLPSSSRCTRPPMTTLVPEKKFFPLTMTVALPLPEFTQLMAVMPGAKDDCISAVLGTIKLCGSGDWYKPERSTFHNFQLQLGELVCSLRLYFRQYDFVLSFSVESTMLALSGTGMETTASICLVPAETVRRPRTGRNSQPKTIVPCAGSGWRSKATVSASR